jgi:hypothetical protein
MLLICCSQTVLDIRDYHHRHEPRHSVQVNEVANKVTEAVKNVRLQLI